MAARSRVGLSQLGPTAARLEHLATQQRITGFREAVKGRKPTVFTRARQSTAARRPPITLAPVYLKD
jgi:hypothetical protein